MTHKWQISYHILISTALDRDLVRTINTWPAALFREADNVKDIEHQIATLAIYTVYIFCFYLGS